MTIHAYTELHHDYPAFVNLSEKAGGLFALTVRSQGDGGRNVGVIELTGEQLLNLISDVCEHLEGHGKKTENTAASADRKADEQRWRAHALDLALRTPGVNQYSVLKLAAELQAYIDGGQVANKPTLLAGPDVKQMVDRFLGWRLPETFHPDAGISFQAPQHPLGWPTGTNLLNAEEARAMFEHVLRTPE